MKRIKNLFKRIWAWVTPSEEEYTSEWIKYRYNRE